VFTVSLSSERLICPEERRRRKERGNRKKAGRRGREEGKGDD